MALHPSGLCLPLRKNSIEYYEIYGFRKKEIVKLILHELIHASEKIPTHLENNNISYSEKWYKLQLPYEGITEYISNILYLCWADKIHLYNDELEYSIYMTASFLYYFGYRDYNIMDFFINGNNIINDRFTNYVSYYVHRNLFYLNRDLIMDFILRIFENKEMIFDYDKFKANYDKYIKVYILDNSEYIIMLKNALKKIDTDNNNKLYLGFMKN
jgi:hypothetical protein